MEFNLLRRWYADVAEGDVRSLAVVDGVERDDCQSAEWSAFPIPGQGNVLDRLDGQHFAYGDGIAQPQAHPAADSWIELGLIHPASQSLRGGQERVDEVARCIDLSLKLDPVVAHSPTDPDARLGRNLK